MIYAFWNPIKNVDTNSGKVEYFDNPFNIVIDSQRYSNGVVIKSQNPVGAFVEAGFLTEAEEKMQRGGWWFEKIAGASIIDDFENVKQIIDKIELPTGEKIFIPQYKKGKKLERYSVGLDGFKNSLGNLSRQKMELIAKDISKETGQNYVTLTAQGLYDSSAKGGPIRKQMEDGWAHLLHGFIDTEKGISTGRAGVDADGLRGGSSDGPSCESGLGFAVFENVPYGEELLKKEEAEHLQLIEKKRAELSFNLNEKKKSIAELEKGIAQL